MIPKFYNSANYIIEEIRYYGKPEAKWRNNEEALPIIEEVVNNTVTSMLLLYFSWGEPELTPTNNGTLELEWFFYEGDIEFCLEIGKDNFSFLIRHKKDSKIDYYVGTSDFIIENIRLVLNTGNAALNGDMIQVKHMIDSFHKCSYSK